MRITITIDLSCVPTCHPYALPPPASINSLLIERNLDMKNLKFVWPLPTAREGGLPLDPSAIFGTKIYIQAAPSEPFTLLDTVPAPVNEFVQNDLPDGDYVFRFVTVDKQTPAKEGAPLDVPYRVTTAPVVLPPPAMISGVTITEI